MQTDIEGMVVEGLLGEIAKVIYEWLPNPATTDAGVGWFTSLGMAEEILKLLHKKGAIAEKRAQPRYEYEIVEYTYWGAHGWDTLKEMGEEGWKAIGTVRSPGTGDVLIFLMRELEGEGDA